MSHCHLMISGLIFFLFVFYSVNALSTRFNYLSSDWDYNDILFDGSNNLYFTALKCLANGSCHHVLHRVTPTSNGELNIKPISVEDETVWWYCVDKRGNTLYGLAGGEWMRYIKANGELGERTPTVKKTYGDAPIYICTSCGVAQKELWRFTLLQPIGRYEQEVAARVYRG